MLRTRRAYFDCRYGQLHVRSAFPSTGGFGENVPLFCLHSEIATSRFFGLFLPQIADIRSVYAPDLPGFGESDDAGAAVSGAAATASESAHSAACALVDLAGALGVRKIDVLGVQFGAEVALALAAMRPELVRRLILADVSASALTAASVEHTLVLDADRVPLFAIDPRVLAAQISAFLQ